MSQSSLCYTLCVHPSLEIALIILFALFRPEYFKKLFSFSFKGFLQ